MNKIVGKESLSDKVVKFEIEAPLIAKAGNRDILSSSESGKRRNAFLTQLQLPILKKEQSLWLSNV